MDDISSGELFGIIGAAVTGAVILFRVVEKVIDHFIEQVKSKRQGEENIRAIRALKTGNTADIAVQGNAIRAIVEDIENLKSLSYDQKSFMSKDLVFQIDKLEDRLNILIEGQKEQLKESQELRRTIENSTASTKALQNLLMSFADRR